MTFETVLNLVDYFILDRKGQFDLGLLAVTHQFIAFDDFRIRLYPKFGVSSARETQQFVLPTRILESLK